MAKRKSKAKSGRADAESGRQKEERRPHQDEVDAAEVMSLHIGLNSVGPDALRRLERRRSMACEFDANDMAAIAKAQRMKPTVLLTKKATRAQHAGSASAPRPRR